MHMDYTSFAIFLYVLTARDINCLLFAGSRLFARDGRLDAFAFRLSNGLPDMIFCTFHKASPFFLLSLLNISSSLTLSSSLPPFALLSFASNFISSKAFLYMVCLCLSKKPLPWEYCLIEKPEDVEEASVAGSRGWDCLCCSALAVVCISNLQCLSLRLSVLCVLIGCSFCLPGRRSRLL